MENDGANAQNAGARWIIPLQTGIAHRLYELVSEVHKVKQRLGKVLGLFECRCGDRCVFAVLHRRHPICEVCMGVVSERNESHAPVSQG